MTDHARKLVSQTILYLPAQFLPPLLQFATMIVWTHLLRPDGFGITSFVLAAQEFTAMLAITWWSLFVLRFRSRYADQSAERFRQMDSLVVGCSILLQLALTLPVLALSGATLDLPLFLSTAGFFIMRTIFAHYGDWARADQRIAAFTTAQLIGAVGASGLSILALLVLGPVPAAALGAQGLSYGIALVLLARTVGLRVQFGRFDRSIYASAMRYGAPLILSGVLSWVAGNSIRIIVQVAEGAVALGLFSVGWSLGQRVATVLAMLFAAAAYPLAVSNLEGGDRHGALSQVSLNGVFLLTMLMPASAGVALLSAPLVNMLIAEPFRAVTIVILPIAILAAAVRALRIHTSDQTMVLLEHTYATLYVSIFEAAANAVCGVIGLLWGGIVGAALGVLAGTTAAAVVSFAYSFLRLGLPVPSIGTLLRIVLATLVMSAGIWFLPIPAGIMAVALTVLAGAAAYAAMILLTFPECRIMVGRQLRGEA